MSTLSGLQGKLAAADWLHRPETQALFAAFAAAGQPARVVGGAVRNTLLGLAVDDIDIATPVLPEAVERIARGAGFAAVPTGIAHGTVTVVVNHQPFEVTTLRRDVTTDGRRATVAFTTDWAEDAGRRDFTVNALYCDPDGTVHDPVGGLPDLEARRIRFIGDADTRIAEDYLRILRFFRFFASHGDATIDRDGALACERGRAGLAQLSRERVRAELFKLLKAPRANAGIAAMAAHGLLPAILGGVGYPASLGRLIAIEAATRLPPDPALRLVALAVRTAEDAARIATLLRLSNDERAIISAAARSFAERDVERAGVGEARDREHLYRFGPDRYRRAILCHWLQSGAAVDDPAWMARLQLPAQWPVPEFPLNGSHLLAAGLTAGPELGMALARLEQTWIDSTYRLDRQALLTIWRRG